MNSSRNYYEILGVKPSADLQTLKKAFHRLSKLLHPDTTLLPLDEAEYQFHQVCEAYQLLSDPLTRKVYDKALRKETVINDYEYLEQKVSFDSPIKRSSHLDNRRPLSGGELLSLLLLFIALSLSLLLAIGFALLDGRDLQVSPSWLQSNQSVIYYFPYLDDTITTS